MGSRSRGGGYWACCCGCNGHLVAQRPVGAGELLLDRGAHRALWDADSEQASSLRNDLGPGFLLAASGFGQGARAGVLSTASLGHLCALEATASAFPGEQGWFGQVWAERPGEGGTFTAEQQLSNELPGCTVRGRLSSGRLGHWPEEEGIMSHLMDSHQGLVSSVACHFLL